MEKKTASAILLTLLLTSTLTLAFNIQPVKASGTIYIRADGSMSSLGQSVIQWNKTYGWEGIDKAYSLVQKNDGGYAVAGYTNSFGAGDYDFLLIKLAPLHRTITVPDDYPTIQEAINNANERDIVYVRAGIYYENIVVNKTVSLVGENRNATIIDGNGSGDVIVCRSVTDITISNFTIQNGQQGLDLTYSHDCLIADNRIIHHSVCGITGGGSGFMDNFILRNTISYCQFDGIRLGTGAQKTQIKGNVIANVSLWWAIVIDDSWEIIVEKNDISNTSGIRFYRSDGNIVGKNTISKSLGADAIVLFDSSNNIIEGNRLTDNGGGLYVYGVNNTIYENDIADNNYGISIGKPDNTIYHNNFANNYYQVRLIDGLSIENQWDNGYPSGGNYWSDYAGNDTYSGPYQNETCSDGIGDAPYVIDENNQDNYPLMQPYNGPVRNLNTGHSYPTIQKAINNANEGNKILALSGVYYEHIVVNKTVSLIGENKDKTIIDGDFTGTVVTISVHSVTFSGFTVRNSASYPNSGIYLYLAQYCTIANNIVTNNCIGINHGGSHYNTVVGNDIVLNYNYGVSYSLSENNSLLKNYIANNWYGITFDGSYLNNVTENNVANNTLGIHIGFSGHITFHHNNFDGNRDQVYIYESRPNSWDDGYPSGGNYWSDYVGVDVKSGPNQDLHGSDSIGDTPYIIDANNRDHYPLMKPWTPIPLVVTATVDIHPQALNLRSRGKWVTAYIQLPKGYNVSDIAVSSIMLNGTIPMDMKAPITIGDYDNDTIPDLMVKFNRTAVSEFILDQNITYGNVTLTITGEVAGTLFEGSDIIMVRMPGDVNCDGTVDIYDVVLVCGAYGSTDSYTDLNEDGMINIYDVVITCSCYGKTYP
jgi:parallel beta-helix repeat protein